MGMHKIFIGAIVFFSLAFLAACGGGGSGAAGSAGATGAAGAAGATGDTGAAGAAGSVSVPSASTTLTIVASTTLDTDITLGEVHRTYTVSGMDNNTATTAEYVTFLI